MTSNTIPKRDVDHILNHTRPLFEGLDGQSLFITGGTGFFGTWLLETIAHARSELKLDLSATILTRSAAKFAERSPHLAADPAFRFVEGDVRSFPFPSEKYPVIIHAATAASASLNEADPQLMLDTVIEGTRHTLEFAKHCGARKFLLTSSGAIYGRQPSELTHVPEDYAGAPDPMDSNSAYGQGKRVAEHLCAIFHKRYGIETKIARCFAFVGPHLPLDIHFAIGNFIRDGLQGGPIRVGGDGTPYRSYLYAADLMIWLLTILEQGQPCRPYNVGSATDLSIADVARAVAAHFKTDVKIAKQPVSGQPISRYVPATHRAEKELGLKTWVGLDDAIVRTADWYRKRDGRET